MLIWICLAACTIASTKDSSSAFSHGCYFYSCWLAQDHTSLRHVWRMNDSSFRRFGAPFLTITKFLSKETGRQVDRQGDSRFKVGVFSEKMQLGLPLKSSQTTILGSCERIMLGRKLSSSLKYLIPPSTARIVRLTTHQGKPIESIEKQMKPRKETWTWHPEWVLKRVVKPINAWKLEM